MQKNVAIGLFYLFCQIHIFHLSGSPVPPDLSVSTDSPVSFDSPVLPPDSAVLSDSPYSPILPDSLFHLIST